MTTTATVTGVVIETGAPMVITSAAAGVIAAPNGGGGAVGSTVAACTATVVRLIRLWTELQLGRPDAPATPGRSGSRSPYYPCAGRSGSQRLCA